MSDSAARELDGRRVSVTGAAAVKAFAAHGATVAATYHHTPAPQHLQPAVRWWQCDFRSRTEVQRTIDDVTDTPSTASTCSCTQPDSGSPGYPIRSEDDLDFLIATNLKATVFTNQAAFTAMRNHGGRIINLGSSEAVTGSPIAATKGAVHAWTRTVAKAWAYCGVTVNAVAPAVETPGAQRLREFLGPDGAKLLDQQLQSSIPRPSR